MKTRISFFTVLMFILTITLNACKSSAGTGYELSQLDSQESYSQNGLRAEMAASSDSVYFMRDNYLYVIDKSTHKCMPLCSKPDCQHDHRTEYPEECDAYFNKNGSIAFYDGHLYISGEKYKEDENGETKITNVILQMNADGSDRKEIFSTEMALWNFKLHRGYIYFTASEWTEDNGARGIDAALYKTVLGETKPKKLEQFDKERQLMDVRFCGNYMIILTLTMYNNSSEYKTQMMSYDLTTGESKTITDTADFPAVSSFTIYNNKIVLSDNENIYECGPEGDNCKKVAECSKMCEGYDYYNVTSNDGENLLINACLEGHFERSEIIVCDKKYNVQKKCQMPFDCHVTTFCEPEFMLVTANDKLYWVNKEMLGINDCAKEIYKFG